MEGYDMSDSEKLDALLLKMDKLDTIEQEVSKINLMLENEIRVNIQRIAEGHLDLSRNLHDAIRPSSEVEMLAIRVRMLETEIQELKKKIS